MQNLQIPANSIQTRGVRTDTVDTILMKFFFTNPAHIPEGLPRRKVSSQKRKEIDQFNSIVAVGQGQGALGQVGRIRDGRVDTGTQTVNNLQLVQLGLIRRGLTNVGFQLRAIDVYLQKADKPGKMDKWVVCLVFERGYFEEASATPEALEAHKLINSTAVVSAIRKLANTTWQWCHVWDNNATRKTATVNVGGRLPEGRPCHAIAVRQGEIVPIQIATELEESEE